MSNKSLVDMVEIANPQHQKIALLLLLDTSGSMLGSKIDQLNEALILLKQDLVEDDLARKRVEIAVITFGERISVNCAFSSVEDFTPIPLKADGRTSMGDAISLAIDIVEQRKNEYKSSGVDYYRPWIFMITDGEPTDMEPGDLKWSETIKKLSDGEKNSKFSFFAIGVEPANTQILKQISKERDPLFLKENKFREMFLWLSNSVQKVSRSHPGEQITFEDPTAPFG